MKPSLQILVIMDMTYQSGREQLAGIYRYAAHKPGWDIHLRTDSEFKSIDEQALEGKIDGIILKNGTSLPAIAKFFGKLPIVLIDRPHDREIKSRRTAVITSDNVNVGRAAADCLLSLGRFATFAYVTDEYDYEWSRDRYRGFADTLASKGLSPAFFARPKGATDDEEIRCLADWLKSLQPPMAVFAAYDSRARIVLDACRKSQLAAPRDVAILGVDNDLLICENSRPRLSSVKLDNEGQGFIAAKSLDSLLRGKSKGFANPILCPHLKIVERESTAPVAPATYLVERIGELIDAKACDGIRVEDIARELGVSYRLAILRYQQLKGQSIREALICRRLAEVQRLLKDTSYPMVRIARLCGFKSNVVLSHLFTRRFGVSMGEWRLRNSRSNR